MGHNIQEDQMTDLDIRFGDVWQPIETAPRDGSPMLFGNKEGVEIGWFDFCYHVQDYYPTNHEADVLSVTHWMPLPKPPGTEP